MSASIKFASENSLLLSELFYFGWISFKFEKLSGNPGVTSLIIPLMGSPNKQKLKLIWILKFEGRYKLENNLMNSYKKKCQMSFALRSRKIKKWWYNAEQVQKENEMSNLSALCGNFI